MIPIKEIGEYWEVNSNNCIINNYKNIELLPITNDIKSLFLKEVFNYIPYIHSIYLSGAYLNGKIIDSSSINFLVVTNDRVNVDNLENELDSLKEILEISIEKKLNSKILVDISVETINFFQFDLLVSRFTTKCIWGEDISINEIDFDLIDERYLDGLEKEDQEYLQTELDEIIFVIENLNQNEIYLIGERTKNYLKLVLRCSFNCVCKKIKVWTRDLYYCNYFFSKEKPDLEKYNTQCLKLYLNFDKEEKKEILKSLYDAKKIVNYICSN